MRCQLQHQLCRVLKLLTQTFLNSYSIYSLSWYYPYPHDIARVRQCILLCLNKVTGETLPGDFFRINYIFYIINILVIRTILSIHYWFIWHYFMSIYPVPDKDNHNWWTKLQDPWVTPSSQAFYWSRLETGPAFSFLYRLTTGPVLCSHLPHLYHQQFFFQFQKNILLKGVATVTTIY